MATRFPDLIFPSASTLKLTWAFWQNGADEPLECLNFTMSLQATAATDRPRRD